MKRCAVVSAAIVFPLIFILNYVEAKAAAAVCLCLVAFLIVALIMKNKPLIFAAVFGIAASLSVFLFGLFGAENDAAYNGLTLKINATVEHKYSDDMYLLKINEAESDGKEIDINGKVVFYDFSDTVYDEKDIIFGSVHISVSQSNNTIFRSNYADGAFIQAYVQGETEYIGKEKTTILDIPYILRQYIQRVCRKIGGDEGGLVLSLLTGDKSYISDETVNAFRNCGLSHIMAVSGMNLSIVTSVAVLLLDKLEIDRKLRQLISAALILFVMAAASFSFSVTRAGIMSAVFILAYSFRRKSDALNSLGVSVTVICLINPYSVMDIGFILSVSATFGILIIMPLFYRFLYKIRFGVLRWIVNCILLSVSATIGILPAAAFAFSSVSLMGLALCVVTSIFAGVLTISGFILCVLGYVPGISFVLIHITRFAAKIFIEIVKYCSRFDYAIIDFDPYPLMVFFVLLLLFCALRATPFGKKVRKNMLLACGSIAFAVAFLCSARLALTECEVIVSGENNSLGVYAQTENGFAVLDCTDMARAREIKSYIGDTDKINLYFLPEYSDSRLEVLSYFSELNKIEKIIIPDIDDKQKYDIIELFKDTDTKVILGDGGCSFNYNEITVSLYPYGDSALIPHISYNGFGAVYLSKSVDPSMATYLPKADMLIMNGKSLSSIRGIDSTSPKNITLYNASYGDMSRFNIDNKSKDYSVTEVVGTVRAAVEKSGRFTVYGETE